LSKSALAISVDAKNHPQGQGVLTSMVGNLSAFAALRPDPALTAFRKQVASIQIRLSTRTAGTAPTAVIGDKKGKGTGM
jgi:hypothetical protein